MRNLFFLVRRGPGCRRRVYEESGGYREMRRQRDDTAGRGIAARSKGVEEEIQCLGIYDCGALALGSRGWRGVLSE